MAGFKFLMGDVNWIDYGGTFYKRIDADTFYVLSFDSWENMVGEKEAAEVGYKYNAQLSIMSIDDKEKIVDAFYSAGLKLIDGKVFDFSGNNVIASAKSEVELMILEALFDYGYKDVIFDGNGNNARKLLSEAKSYSF